MEGVPIHHNKIQHLTHGILVDSSSVLYWVSPFINSGVFGVFCRFFSNFDKKSC